MKEMSLNTPYNFKGTIYNSLKLYQNKDDPALENYKSNLKQQLYDGDIDIGEYYYKLNAKAISIKYSCK